MKTKEITAAERKVIEILLQDNYTQSRIAKHLGFAISTISREIKNRGTPNGYFAEIAQVDYEVKRKKTAKNGSRIMRSEIRNYVLRGLQEGWSPEQISGRMKYEGIENGVCMETIYAFVYKDKWCIDNKIYEYLPRKKKRRTKWKGRGSKRSLIPNRVSISQRPKIVEKRTEFGHWEGDSVIFPNKKAINTVNELKTGYVEFRKMTSKTAQNTSQAMIKSLEWHEVKTMTLDNGSEFVRHEEVSKAKKCDIYFADPYSSWQRGANENVNMLLRRYLPKKKNIDKLTQEELDDISEEINNRPRKRLNYQTPAESYQQHILSKCCSSV